MNTRLFAALVLGLLCGAATYSFRLAPGYELNAGVFFQMGLLAFLSTLLTAIFFKVFEVLGPVFLCVGFMMAVFGRIFYDGLFTDSTSHNLWPFEMLIILAVVAPSAFAGAGVAHLVNRMRK